MSMTLVDFGVKVFLKYHIENINREYHIEILAALKFLKNSKISYRKYHIEIWAASFFKNSKISYY